MNRGTGSGQNRAGNRGYGQRSWGGQNAARSPYVIQMPKFLEPIGETGDVEDQSIIVVDSRNDRMVSPFQTWLVSEIMSNAASSINVLTERDQVMPPSSGFHVSLFANYTLDGIKAIWRSQLNQRQGTPVPIGMRMQLAPSPIRRSSLFLADVEGYFCILHRHQGLQRERDPVPLGLEGIQIIALDLKVYLYVDRVPTDANPADPPSRDHMQIGESLGWKTVSLVFPCL